MKSIGFDIIKYIVQINSISGGSRIVLGGGMEFFLH